MTTASIRRRPGWRLTLAVALLAAALPVMMSDSGPAYAASEPGIVTVDYSRSDGVGHPEVFGSGRNSCNPEFGASAPCQDTESRMDTLRQSGVTLVRRDAYLSEIVPNTTIDDYLHNVGGVADPQNWDWSKYQWVDTYRRAGFKLVLVMGYNVTWNGYDCGGTCPSFGPSVPQNFDVYADMVRKVYKHFDGKVDLVEIWNEPDSQNFFNLAGSPYPATLAGRLSAYTDVYERASSAIRQMSKTVQIGGPVVASPAVGQDWATALFKDRRIPAKNLNFLSYHNYKESVTTESVTDWKDIAAANGRGRDFPVYVTEWNRSPAYDQNPLNTDHPDTISYTGSRLTTFFKQHANGTNYFNDNDSDSWPAFFGIYANGVLPPKSRTYRLLSRDLGLGAGRSTLRPVTCGTGFSCPLTNGAAATNSAGNPVAWVVNDNTAPVDVTMNLTGLKNGTTYLANIFEASSNQAVPSPKAVIPAVVARGKVSLRLVAPAKSVVGVRLTRYQIADAENLAPAAAATSSSIFPGYPASNVTDGVVGLVGAGEWASNGEQRPWLQLTWPSPQSVGRVMLYDRATGEHILAGRLVFNDGSTVAVPALPDDGTGRAVSFPVRSVKSVRFEVTEGAGPNVGLTEFQAFESTNIASQGTITSSSQLDADHGQLNVVDGVVGEQTGEWASSEKNPWVQVSWVNSRTIEQVVLHDRAGTTSNATGGVLTFSDGSSVLVGGIPRDGSAKAVLFSARPVKWVRFQVEQGSGSNVGLSEFRVMQAPNLASSATVTTSSTYDQNFTSAGANDGVVNQRFIGDWASNGQVNPWIQLTWPTAQSIGHVVLYDRNDLGANANGGTLTFSDGSSVEVSGIDGSGLGKVVDFPARAVTWVHFQVVGGTGQHVGLSEFQAFPPAS